MIESATLNMCIWYENKQWETLINKTRCAAHCAAEKQGPVSSQNSSASTYDKTQERLGHSPGGQS